MSTTSSSNVTVPATTTKQLTKRKLDDAINLLDTSLASSPSFSSLTGKSSKRPKRPTVIRTSTPALESILAAHRTSLPPVYCPPSASYDPSSLSSLLTRLATFKLSTYLASPPPSLSPLSLALQGWINRGPARNRIECVSCHAGIVVLAPKEGWSSRIGERTREAYERKLSGAAKEAGGDEEGHAAGCAWTVAGCRRSIYRVGAARGETRSRVMEELMKRARSFGKWRIALADYAALVPEEKLDKVLQSMQQKWKGQAGDGECGGDWLRTSTLLALFGWSIILPSTSRSASTQSLPIESTQPSTDLVLQCHMCARQVLLSSYLLPEDDSLSTISSPKRSFNPITQHQSFCAYVDTSASLLVRSSSASSINSLEAAGRSIAGWEKILEVVLGKSRIDASPGLKSTTKEVMAYVRGLLGPITRKPLV